MNSLLVQAIKKAGQLRTKLKLDIAEPVNIFDVCRRLGLTVRFIDVSMEGMYVHQEGAKNQTILISSLRPLPRRFFTCAHELGHHIFGHGSRIDGLTENTASSSVYDNDEFLVDSFAGAFLMPIAGIEAEFRKRSWDFQNASPIQFYTISSIFGVGYSTLITHCKSNKLIIDTKATSLLKQSPGKLLQGMLGDVDNSHFKIIDAKARLSVIDVEVGNYLFLPVDFGLEGGQLGSLIETSLGKAYIAKNTGIIRTVSKMTGSSCFIRIQNTRYVGLAENRHLESKCD